MCGWLMRAPDIGDTVDIIKRYEVEYVVVGDLERLNYGDSALAKFETWSRQGF